jgi:hypothetical protein
LRSSSIFSRILFASCHSEMAYLFVLMIALLSR